MAAIQETWHQPPADSLTARGRALQSPATILGVAALVRALAWAAGLSNPESFLGGDTDEYWMLSDDPIASYSATEGPLYALGLSRPPAYPIILALFRSTGGGEPVAALLQILFALATIWLVVTLGRSLIGDREAAAAGWWLALDPLHVVESSILLTEIPFSFAVVVATFAAWKAVRTGKAGWIWWGVVGATVGLATLIRPISYYMPVVLCPLVALAARRRVGWRASTAGALVLLAAFLLPVGLWIGRNARVTGVATVSTIQGLNLAYYRAAAALVEGEGVPLPDARRRIEALVDARLPEDANPAVRSKAEERVAIGVIVGEPAGYTISAAKGAARTLVGPGRAHLSVRVAGLPFANVLTFGLVGLAAVSAFAGTVLGFAGFWIWARRGSWVPFALTATPVFYLLIVGSGLEAFSRFRLQMLPSLLMAAACALIALYDRVAGSRREAPARSPGAARVSSSG